MNEKEIVEIATQELLEKGYNLDPQQYEVKVSKGLTTWLVTFLPRKTADVIYRGGITSVKIGKKDLKLKSISSTR